MDQKFVLHVKKSAENGQFSYCESYEKIDTLWTISQKAPN
jgi:hypothetical protein